MGGTCTYKAARGTATYIRTCMFVHKSFVLSPRFLFGFLGDKEEKEIQQQQQQHIKEGRVVKVMK